MINGKPDRNAVNLEETQIEWNFDSNICTLHYVDNNVIRWWFNQIIIAIHGEGTVPYFTLISLVPLTLFTFVSASHFQRDHRLNHDFVYLITYKGFYNYRVNLIHLSVDSVCRISAVNHYLPLSNFLVCCLYWRPTGRFTPDSDCLHCVPVLDFNILLLIVYYLYMNRCKQMLTNLFVWILSR